MFIEREREREQVRGTERGREKIPSRLCTVSMETDAELERVNREITT